MKEITVEEQPAVPAKLAQPQLIHKEKHIEEKEPIKELVEEPSVIPTYKPYEPKVNKDISRPTSKISSNILHNDSKKEINFFIENRHYILHLNEKEVHALLVLVLQAKEDSAGNIHYNEHNYLLDADKTELLDRFLVYVLGAKILI